MLYVNGVSSILKAGEAEFYKLVVRREIEELWEKSTAQSQRTTVNRSLLDICEHLLKEMVQNNKQSSRGYKTLTGLWNHL